jgi:hypothetical protein
MHKNFNSEYDIIIIGTGLFSTELALQLTQTKLKILLIFQQDFNTNNENVLVDLSNFSKISEQKYFYKKFTHSLIPIKLFTLKKENLLKYFLFNIKSIFSKKLIRRKAFSIIEKSIILASNTTIKTKNNFKLNYSRLCIDTVKTAQKRGIHVLNYSKINKIDKNIITLENKKKINTKIVINTDINFAEETIINLVKIIKSNSFSIPKQTLNISNPISIKNKNIIDIIPYFSEVIINSKNNLTEESILRNINKTLGININKNAIIIKHSTNNYSSELLEDKKNILNIFESDYTKYEEKINLILKKLSIYFNFNPLQYKQFTLSTNFIDFTEQYQLIRLVEEKYLQIQETGISPNEFTVLFYRYGKDIDFLNDKAYDFYNDKKTRKHAWLYAELSYSVNFEFVKTIDDFVKRRTNLFLINQLDSEKKEIIINFIENYNE